MARLSAALRVTITPDPPAGALLALADRLRRLSPSTRDPERFHVKKSDIEGKLRRLAYPPSSTPRWGSALRQGAGDCSA